MCRARVSMGYDKNAILTHISPISFHSNISSYIYFLFVIRRINIRQIAQMPTNLCSTRSCVLTCFDVCTGFLPFLKGFVLFGLIAGKTRGFEVFRITVAAFIEWVIVINLEHHAAFITDVINPPVCVIFIVLRVGLNAAILACVFVPIKDHVAQLGADCSYVALALNIALEFGCFTFHLSS